MTKKNKNLKKFLYVLLLSTFYSSPGLSKSFNKLSKKMEKEILSNLEDQSKTLAKYSNEMTGFKINFKKLKDIDLSLKNLEFLTSQNIYSKARYNYLVGEFHSAYSLLTMLSEDERTDESDTIMISSLLKTGMNKKADDLLPLFMSESKKNDVLVELDLLNCVETSCAQFHNKFKKHSELQKKGINNKLYYEIGKKLFFKNKMSQADLVFSKINKNHVNYLKGRYFKAVHLISLNHISAAIIEMKNLNDLIKSNKNLERLTLKQLQEHVNMSLGRLYYEDKKYEAAISWYNKIDRKSKLFSQAMEEISWTMYKLQKSSLSKNIIEGINISEESGKIAMDILLLKGKMYINDDEHDKALSMYEKAESIYLGIRKQIEDIVVNNKDIEDIINIFINLSIGDVKKKREKALNDWIEYSDLNDFSKYMKAYKDINSVISDINKSETLMNEIKNKLMGKRNFLSVYEKFKSDPGDFEELGRRIYEIIQDVREREIYVLCLNVTQEICKGLKEFSKRRFYFYKKEIVKEEGNERKFESFRIFQKYLVEEENEIQKVRSAYKYSNKVLNAIDKVKTRFSRLNDDYLNLQAWIETQLMDNYGGYREKEKELNILRKEAILIGKRLVKILFEESTTIYSLILNRINRYKYNITIGKNEILFMAKTKYMDEYLKLEKDKEKKILHLKESFTEVFSETN